MPLTAQEHQKIAALQQIANLVGQAQSVAGNQQVLNNIINSSLPLISQWERSDPEFTELAIQMRRARSGMSPHYLTNIAGQAQRMISLIRTGLPHRTDPIYGFKTQWDPIRGHVSSPLFEEDEPVRTYSHMGWRGSKRFPMGLPFPQKNVIEGWDGLGNNKDLSSKARGAALGIGAGILTGLAIENLSEEIENPVLRVLAGPASASIATLGVYWLSN